MSGESKEQLDSNDESDKQERNETPLQAAPPIAAIFRISSGRASAGTSASAPTASSKESTRTTNKRSRRRISEPGPASATAMALDTGAASERSITIANLSTSSTFQVGRYRGQQSITANAPPRSNLSRQRCVVTTKTNAKFGVKAKKTTIRQQGVSARPGSSSATAALRMLEHAGVFELYGSRKDGYLRCKYDHKIIGSSTSNVNHHLETAVHINAVASKAREVELNELTIATFEEHFEATNQAGGHTEEQTIVFRTDFLRACLDAGVPLAKMDSFRPFLDQYCKFSSTAATHLSKYVPVLLKSECTILRAALKGQHVLVIFDGTTTVGEIFAIILRWCESDYTVKQKLVHVGIYKSSFEHSQLVQVLTSVLCTSYGIPLENVIGFLRDRASVNTLAVSVMRNSFGKAKDLSCLSHTLCHTGDKLFGQELQPVQRDMSALMSKSNRAKSIWRDAAGEYQLGAWKSHSQTRWWSLYEVIVYILAGWILFTSFPNLAMVNADEGGLDDGALLQRLKSFVADDTRTAIAKLEAACIAIVGKRLVEVTYILEGDSILSVIGFDLLMSVKYDFDAHLPTLSWPGLSEAINDCINALHASDPLKYPADPDGSLNSLGEAFEQRLRQMITPSWTYFEKTILGTLAPMLALLKACRLANPYAFARLQPTADEFRAAVESLDHFTAEDVLSICGGYGEYVRLCSELPALPLHSTPDYEMKSIKSFWRANHATLHKLSPFVRYCFAIQCSSAAVERVFSVLKNSFCSQQELSLEDYMCLSLMRQFNNRGDL
jgi:hAT family C-terminal dimerisation region